MTPHLLAVLFCFCFVNKPSLIINNWDLSFWFLFLFWWCLLCAWFDVLILWVTSLLHWITEHLSHQQSNSAKISSLVWFCTVMHNIYYCAKYRSRDEGCTLGSRQKRQKTRKILITWIPLCLRSHRQSSKSNSCKDPNSFGLEAWFGGGGGVNISMWIVMLQMQHTGTRAWTYRNC